MKNMSATIQQIKEFCRKGKYKSEAKVIEDLRHVFGTYTNLKVCTDILTFDDGSQKTLLNIYGTVPVCYQGGNYNIPIRIWLQRTHPEDPPICYVEPTSGMYVEPSQYVDRQGKIYLAYLHQWTYPAYQTIGLISIIITSFGDIMPVYAKSTPSIQSSNSAVRRDSSVSLASTVSTDSSDYVAMGSGSCSHLTGPYIPYAESCKHLIHKAVSKYKHKDTVKRDVLETLANFKSLKPEVGDWEDVDGKMKKTLSLTGTVPTNYQGSSYNIPVCIWVLKDYPQRAPLCFLRPTRDMAIKACPYVNPSGKIQVDYLQNWKHPNTDIHGVIQVLAAEFGKDCPIYSVSSTPQANNTAVYQKPVNTMPVYQPQVNNISVYQQPANNTSVYQANTPYAAHFVGNDPAYMQMNPVRRAPSTASTSSTSSSTSLSPSSQETYMKLNAKEVTRSDYQTLSTVPPETSSYYNVSEQMAASYHHQPSSTRGLSSRPLPPLPQLPVEHQASPSSSRRPSNLPQGAVAMAVPSPQLPRQPVAMQHPSSAGAQGQNIDRTKMLELQLANAQKELEVMKLKEKTRELEDAQVCSICMENRKSTAFQCGHMTCRECAYVLHECPICRTPIEKRINLFQG